MLFNFLSFCEFTLQTKGSYIMSFMFYNSKLSCKISKSRAKVHIFSDNRYKISY